MPGVNVEVDVDVDDVIDAMTDSERVQLVEGLTEDGYGPEAPQPIDDWIHRIKYLGLDTDLTALEVLERMRDEVAA